MNLVLFLGAGFSKPFGLPTMTEFYQHALADASPLDGAQKNQVRQLRKRVRDTKSMLNGDENNLEDLLSISLLVDDAWPGGTNAELLAILRTVYAPLRPSVCEPIFETALKRLVGYDKIDSHLHTVITTNYDVAAEYGFYRIGRPLGIPGQWKPVALQPNHGLYQAMGSARIICKLHGSVNWQLSGGREVEASLLVDDGVVFVRERGPRQRATESWLPTVSASNHPIPSTPLIVPPTFYKGDYPKCFNPTWSAARRALQEADRVVFVGYSFPSSDTYMKFFLASSLAQSYDLRSIDILDLDANEIVKRLKSESERFGGTFKEKLRAFPGKWEEVGYDILRA